MNNSYTADLIPPSPPVRKVLQDLNNIDVNKAPKRNSLTPTIIPEDDQNSAKPLFITSDADDNNSLLNHTHNRPLPDIVTNVHTNNANISLSELLDNFTSLGISTPNSKRNKPQLNLTTQCVDPVSDDESFVECSSFLDSSDRHNDTTAPLSSLASEEVDANVIDLNVTVAIDNVTQEQAVDLSDTEMVSVDEQSQSIGEQVLSHVPTDCEAPTNPVTDVPPPIITEITKDDLATVHVNLCASIIEMTDDTDDIEHAQEADTNETLSLDSTKAFHAYRRSNSSDIPAYENSGDTTEAMLNLCAESLEEISDSTINTDSLPSNAINVFSDMNDVASDDVGEQNNRTVDEQIHEASEALSISIDIMKTVSIGCIAQNNAETPTDANADEIVTTDVTEVCQSNNETLDSATCESTVTPTNAIVVDSVANSTSDIDKCLPLDAYILQADDKTSEKENITTFATNQNDTLDQSTTSFEMNDTVPMGVTQANATGEFPIPIVTNVDPIESLVEPRVTEIVEANTSNKSSPIDRRPLIPNAFNIPIKIVAPSTSRRLSNPSLPTETADTTVIEPYLAEQSQTLPIETVVPAVDRSSLNTTITGSARLDLHAAIDRLYTVTGNPSLDATIITTGCDVDSPTPADRTINYDLNKTRNMCPTTDGSVNLTTTDSHSQPVMDHTFVGTCATATAFDATVDVFHSPVMGRKSILVRQDLFEPNMSGGVEDMDIDMDFESQDNGAVGGVEDNVDDYFQSGPFKVPQVPEKSEFQGFSNSPFVVSDHQVPSTEVFYNANDFEFLLSKGSNVTGTATAIDNRDSLLIRFDPLLGRPVPRTPDKQYRLSTTKEEPFDLAANVTSVPKTIAAVAGGGFVGAVGGEVPDHGGNATMSAGLINDLIPENDVKPFDSINSKVEKEDLQMADLERKIKVERDDVEKKLKAAEQREESHIKRITEKDKAIAKMSGVMEAYEKAIAELISEKEQIIRSYDSKASELQADRDLNFLHLSSLETTFSDLHVKYERSKQVTDQLKENQDKLSDQNRYLMEQLKLQEQRYDKMKNHALQQLEAANSKLDTILRGHSIELTKLKAQLKKEEISRQSVTEQLVQKTKENEELVKICDELINGQGS